MHRTTRRARLSGVLMLCVPILVGAAQPALAQPNPALSLGAYVEHNYSTQPGIQIGYASPELLGARPRFSVSYSTTRLAAAAGSKGLVEDRVQIGGAWRFRRERAFSPFLGLNLGVSRFDREDEQLFELLDNSGYILSPLAGADARVTDRIRASGTIGYSVLQSSTVYPAVLSIGLHYELGRRGSR